MALSKTIKNVILLVLMVVLLSVAGIVAFITLNTNPASEHLKEKDILPVLMVLSDDEGNALTTNVLLYSALTKKAAMFNIAGNTGAIYRSIARTDRIDAVYKEKGIETYNSEIEDLLGIEIPFTLDINLTNLGQLVDVLGGIKLFIPSPVDEVSKNGDRWLLPGGAVNLDGDKIGTYMVYQLPEEEEDEALLRRQNILISVIAAIKNNKSSLLTKKNFSIISSRISSNLETDGLFAMLDEITNMDTDSLVPLAIKGLVRTVDGKDLIFPLYNGDLVKEVVEQTEASLITELQPFVITIQNGTEVQGLAHNTAVVLRSANYDVISYSNADRTDYAHTVIIDYYGNEEGAKQIGNFLHCSYIRKAEPDEIQSDNDAATIDFTVILGADFDGRYVIGNYTGPEQTQE